MGYLTWIILLLMILGIDLLDKISFNYNDRIAFVVLFIGLVFIVLSLIHLGSSTRLGLPTDETVFKTNGLYRISRNPMYVGFNLLTIASMIYTLHWGVFLLGMYSMAIYHLIILGEERFLINRFGEEYRIYQSKIRRYL